MAGTIVADTIRADSTSTLVLKNGVANTPPTIQDSAGTQIGTFCRAWVNFDGAATSPITPRASFNISSVTRTSTGNFTINFTTAMADANYSVVAGANAQGGALISAMANSSSYAPNAPSAGSFTLLTGSTAAGVNCTYITTAVFR